MRKEARSLFVMPEDGIAPVADAIERAQSSLDIKMFLFTEPRLVNAVIAAHLRGVKTRVMLNPARRSGESENAETQRMLTEAGVEVKNTHPGYQVTHEKSLVVDRHDWDHSHRIDLSDQGIVIEMESHGRRDYGSLALEPEVKTTDLDDRKPNHKKGR